MANEEFFNSGMGIPDQSDALANKLGQFIDIYHIPTKKSVKFKAFLTAFTDQYASDWSSEEVLGRMDPIQTYKGTKRTLSLGWDVPATSFVEAKTNLVKASTLVSMLYPQYEEGDGGASLMSAPPLFKIKFMNLIQDSSKPGSHWGTAKTSGLLGTIGGFTYEPDLEAGFFEPTYALANRDANTKDELTFTGVMKFFFGTEMPEGQLLDDRGKLFPKTIKFQCEFTVLHQHKLGWRSEAQGGNPAQKGFKKFPYTKYHEGEDGKPPAQAQNVKPKEDGEDKSVRNRENQANAEVVAGTIIR